MSSCHIWLLKLVFTLNANHCDRAAFINITYNHVIAWVCVSSARLTMSSCETCSLAPLQEYSNRWKLNSKQNITFLMGCGASAQSNTYNYYWAKWKDNRNAQHYVAKRAQQGRWEFWPTKLWALCVSLSHNTSHTIMQDKKLDSKRTPKSKYNKKETWTHS